MLKHNNKVKNNDNSIRHKSKKKSRRKLRSKKKSRRKLRSKKKSRKSKDSGGLKVDPSMLVEIDAGTILYHGTPNYFNPPEIRDLSNFGTLPYGGGSSVRRWANCNKPPMNDVKFNELKSGRFVNYDYRGRILIYEVKKPLKLLDLDLNFLNIDDSMKYFNKLLKEFKVPPVSIIGSKIPNQDDLKIYICKNSSLDGYKWQLHEKEIALCRPSDSLNYIGQISCDTVAKLGTKFWATPKNKDEIIEYLEPDW
jgi:hypothetical protein